MTDLKALGRARRRGYQRDFFTLEWTIDCKACGEPMDSTSRSLLALIYKYHTKNECLGGW